MIGTRDVAGLEERTEPDMMGTPPFSDWYRDNSQVRLGTFSEAACHGEMLFNCTAGGRSLEALDQAGAANLDGKVLVDVANALDFSHGMPPSLSVCNTDSLAEQIQRAFPGTRVVKSLNTMTAGVMVNPALVPGEHAVFVCGNDESAKTQVRELLQNEFGWQSVIDLGDISAARSVEMVLPLWVRLMGVLGTPFFNFCIAK